MAAFLSKNIQNMKSRPPLLLLCLMACTLSVSHQPKQSKLLAQLSCIDCEYITLDALGNLYTANAKGDLVKYNNAGTQTATSNHKSLGPIRSIDATNPFEIYVFYKEQNKVLFFDNQLNDLGFADFEAAGFFMLSAAARSFDNKIWIFDLNDLRLKKVRKDLNPELMSGNVREFAGEKNFDPSYIGDINKKVFLFNAASGIYEFDIFGNYIRKITLTGSEQLFAHNKDLFFLKENALFRLDPILMTEKQVVVQDAPKDIQQFSISSNRLALLSGNTVFLYAR